MDTKSHSQQKDNRLNETIETDFNSTLLVDGTLFSSDTVYKLIDLEGNDQNLSKSPTQTTCDFN